MAYIPILENKQNMKIFGEFLKNEIQKQNITAESLAHKSGINERTIRNYLNGRMPEHLQDKTYQDILTTLNSSHQVFENFINSHNSNSNDTSHQQNSQFQDNNKSTNNTHIEGDVKNNIGTIKGNVTFN